MPETSIIIRTFNEEKHLPTLFDLLESQTYQDFESVVIDSGSYDRTREIAQKRADLLLKIPQHDFTFGHSLNVGIANSQGRQLVIISAHAYPHNNHWLAHLLEPFQNEKTAMVYGRQKGQATSKFSERLDFERIFGPQFKILTPPHFSANNANSAILRNLWEKHPFNEALPGLEDIEWAKYWMEHGYQVVYQPSACIYHIHSESWSQVRWRYFRESQAARWMGTKQRRHIPRDAWKELRNFLADLRHAVKLGQIREVGSEIFRFRYEKLMGTVQGIWNGVSTQNPLKRQQIFFDKPYQAVVVEGPGQATLKEVKPPTLRPGDTLIQVAYQGICATDLEILDGNLGYYKTGLAQYPIIPGHEFSGRITAVGTKIKHLKEGDRVVVECIQGCGECAFCRKGNEIGCTERCEVGVIGRSGGYAQYITTPGRFVHRIPDSVPLKKACLCEPLAVVLKGLRRLKSATGTTKTPLNCAVIGAGPIGHLTSLVLARNGHSVTLIECNSNRLDYMKGFHQITTRQDLQNLSFFDTFVEATGNADVLETILKDSPAGSAILLLGLPYAKREFNFESIVGYDRTIIGSVGSNTEDFTEAISLMPHLDLTAFFQKILPLPEFEQAWGKARSGDYLKVILQVDPSLDEGIAQEQPHRKRSISEPELITP